MQYSSIHEKKGGFSGAVVGSGGNSTYSWLMHCGDDPSSVDACGDDPSSVDACGDVDSGANGANDACSELTILSKFKINRRGSKVVSSKALL
jgi:hypothetical protein